MKENALFYREYRGKVIVRVKGKGRWVEGKSFKDFCEKKFKEGKEIYLDLGECQILDSTFLGIIVAFLTQGKKIFLFNVKSPHIWRSIRTLGLEEIIPVINEEEAPSFPEEVKEWEIPVISLSLKEEKEIVSQAHLNLVKAVPANLSRFQGVLDLMEKVERESLRRIPWRKK